MLYRIVDWEKHFENNRSKKLIQTSWVPVPNRMDGFGYLTLVSHPNGAAHFGAWIAIVEIASACDERGTLRRRGTALGAQELALISHLSATVFEEVLPRLLKLQWIEQVTGGEQSSAPIGQEDAPIGHPTDEERKKERRERKNEFESVELTPDQPGYWSERMYERHPKKKDLVLVHPVVEKLFAKHGADELKRIDGLHERKCKEWQAEPKFAPSLAKWLEDRGWTEVKPAYVSETKLWDPMEGLRD